MGDQNKKIFSFCIVCCLLFPGAVQGEYNTYTDKKEVSQVSLEVDKKYVEDFKKNFAHYENPYKIIDTDYHNQKINKPTWQASWDYIAQMKKESSYNSTKKQDEKKQEKQEVQRDFVQKQQELQQLHKKQQQKKGDDVWTRDLFQKKYHGQIMNYKTKFSASLESRLTKMNEEQLNKVLVNIENAVKRVENTKIKEERKNSLLTQLFALQELIQEQLDAILGDEIDLDALLDVE